MSVVYDILVGVVHIGYRNVPFLLLHFQVSLHVLRVVRTCAPLRWIDMLLLVLMFMVHQIGGVDPELLCSTAK